MADFEERSPFLRALFGGGFKAAPFTWPRREGEPPPATEEFAKVTITNTRIIVRKEKP